MDIYSLYIDRVWIYEYRNGIRDMYGVVWLQSLDHQMTVPTIFECGGSGPYSQVPGTKYHTYRLSH